MFPLGWVLGSLQKASTKRIGHAEWHTEGRKSKHEPQHEPKHVPLQHYWNEASQDGEMTSTFPPNLILFNHQISSVWFILNTPDGIFVINTSPTEPQEAAFKLPTAEFLSRSFGIWSCGMPYKLLLRHTFWSNMVWCPLWFIFFKMYHLFESWTE